MGPACLPISDRPLHARAFDATLWILPVHADSRLAPMPVNSSIIVIWRSENSASVWVRIFLPALLPPLNQKVLDLDDLSFFKRDSGQLRTNFPITAHHFAR